VKGACQRTCDFCPCQDDSSFVYDFDDEGLRGCDWLLEEGDPLIDASRIDDFCYADEEKTVASEVGDACVLSCGFCSESQIEFEFPSLSPTKTISVAPSRVPTLIPSLHSAAPSSKPSTLRSEHPMADPSATPSAYPSQKPSHQPTTIPSLPAPSGQPSTEAPTNCIDDTLFNFTLDIGSIQDCEWLTRNSDPIKVALRITRYCNRGHVKGACQRTCDFCPCQDDSSFVYDFDDEGLRGCDWLLEEGDPLIDASRIDDFCYADEEKTVASEVGNACVLSCGFCSIGNLALPA